MSYLLIYIILKISKFQNIIATYSIIYDNFSINIIENNLLVEKKNNKEIFDKILDNSIYKLYFSIYKIMLLNIDTDELYHKGLFILNKLNKLIKT